MPACDKLLKCHAVPTPFRQPMGAVSTNAAWITACVRWDAGAIPAASTFSEHASTGDRERQDTSNLPDGERIAIPARRAVVRQEATGSGRSRPTRTTKSATGPVVDDLALAVVVAAWPDLPDSVRAGILAMATGLAHLKNSI